MLDLFFPCGAGGGEDALDWPPNPNKRMLPFVKREAIRKWRTRARDFAVNAQLPSREFVFEKMLVEATFVRRQIGAADEDNDHAALKPILDGFRDAGLVRNDTRGFVKWGDILEEKGSPTGIRIKLSEFHGHEHAEQLVTAFWTFMMRNFGVGIDPYYHTNSDQAIHEFVVSEKIDGS